jgi:hypothetical protein
MDGLQMPEDDQVDDADDDVSDDEHFEARVNVLIENVRQHVEGEED